MLLDVEVGTLQAAEARRMRLARSSPRSRFGGERWWASRKRGALVVQVLYGADVICQHRSRVSRLECCCCCCCSSSSPHPPPPPPRCKEQSLSPSQRSVRSPHSGSAPPLTPRASQVASARAPPSSSHALCVARARLGPKARSESTRSRRTEKHLRSQAPTMSAPRPSADARAPRLGESPPMPSVPGSTARAGPRRGWFRRWGARR
jgi:hypothetical protein